MNELSKLIKNKYKEFNITPQWLGKVLRDNNKTRKRTRLFLTHLKVLRQKWYSIN